MIEYQDLTKAEKNDKVSFVTEFYDYDNNQLFEPIIIKYTYNDSKIDLLIAQAKQQKEKAYTTVIRM